MCELKRKKINKLESLAGKFNIYVIIFTPNPLPIRDGSGRQISGFGSGRALAIRLGLTRGFKLEKSGRFVAEKIKDRALQKINFWGIFDNFIQIFSNFLVPKNWAFRA